VLVGSGKKRFIIHQEPLCAKSKFFKAACSKRWIKNEERVVKLPEAKVAAFKAYSSWVYSDIIAEPTVTEKSSTVDKRNERESFIDLYLLGDTLDDILLRNQSLSMLFTSMRNHNMLPGLSSLILIWDSTPPMSLLRKMMVDVYVKKVVRSDFCEDISKYPREFVEEIAMASMKGTPTVGWDEMAKDMLQYSEEALE
jgi:hypothetical protein